jgi:hypothetical protein
MQSSDKSVNDNLLDFELSLHKSDMSKADQKQIIDDIKEFYHIVNS